MKIAIIGDIHSNYIALDAVLTGSFKMVLIEDLSPSSKNQGKKEVKKFKE